MVWCGTRQSLKPNDACSMMYPHTQPYVAATGNYELRFDLTLAADFTSKAKDLPTLSLSSFFFLSLSLSPCPLPPSLPLPVSVSLSVSISLLDQILPPLSSFLLSIPPSLSVPPLTLSRSFVNKLGTKRMIGF